MAFAAVEGAGYNVRINLTSLSDKQFVYALTDDVKKISDEAGRRADRVRALVEEKL